MKGERSLDQCCTLVEVLGDMDEIGNVVVQSSTYTELLCAELPTHSAEFHAAGQHGIRVEQVLEVDVEDYSGQMLVDYKGKRYRIYRTYPRTDGRIELYMMEGVALHE